MNLSGILYSILAADAGVSAICDVRIYPLTIPQQTEFPAIRLTGIAVEPYDTKTGESTLDATRAQIDCYSYSMLTAQQLAAAARAALDRFMGDVWTGTEVYFVDGVRFETDVWAMQEEKDIFRASFDIQIRTHRPAYDNYLVEDDGVTPITTETGQFIIP